MILLPKKIFSLLLSFFQDKPAFVKFFLNEDLNIKKRFYKNTLFFLVPKSLSDCPGNEKGYIVKLGTVTW